MYLFITPRSSALITRTCETSRQCCPARGRLRPCQVDRMVKARRRRNSLRPACCCANSVVARTAWLRSSFLSTCRNRARKPRTRRCRRSTSCDSGSTTRCAHLLAASRRSLPEYTNMQVSALNSPLGSVVCNALTYEVKLLVLHPVLTSAQLV